MRFKELRGLALGMLLAILDVMVIFYGIMSQDKLKLIIAILLSVVVLINLLTQFYVKVLNDCIFLYHFAIIALIPKIVEFKDVLEVKLDGKHHVVLKTIDGNNHIYVWKAKKLYDILINKEKS